MCNVSRSDGEDCVGRCSAPQTQKRGIGGHTFRFERSYPRGAMSTMLVR
jgi:hypothetical protein